jgi:flagellar biosynthesis protein
MIKKEKKYRKKAVALQYKPGEDAAPAVTAKGSGLVAERLIDAARAHGIPVKSDPDLVAVLSKLDIESQIPPSVYIVVAELLAFVYALNGQKEPA